MNAQALKDAMACWSSNGRGGYDVVIGLYSAKPHRTFKRAKDAESFVANYNIKLAEYAGDNCAAPR